MKQVAPRSNAEVLAVYHSAHKAADILMFGKKFAAMLRTPKYERLLRSRDDRNHQKGDLLATWERGTCWIVSEALLRVFPKGRKWILASWFAAGGSEYGDDDGDWSVEHCLVKVGPLLMDSTGAHVPQDVLRSSRKDFPATRFRLAPYGSKQWHGTLVEGDLWHDEKLIAAVAEGARKILAGG